MTPSSEEIAELIDRAYNYYAGYGFEHTKALVNALGEALRLARAETQTAYDCAAKWEKKLEAEELKRADWNVAFEDLEKKLKEAQAREKTECARIQKDIDVLQNEVGNQIKKREAIESENARLREALNALYKVDDIKERWAIIMNATQISSPQRGDGL